MVGTDVIHNRYSANLLKKKKKNLVSNTTPPPQKNKKKPKMDAYFLYKDLSPEPQNYTNKIIEKKQMFFFSKTCNRIVSSRSTHSTVPQNTY